MKHLLLSALLITGCSHAGEERNNCTDNIPVGYRIVKNKYTGKYAVRIIEIGLVSDRTLFLDENNQFSVDGTVKLFITDCEAKEALINRLSKDKSSFD